MTSVPTPERDQAGLTTTSHDDDADYRADVTINAPVESVFAAVSTVEGLSGWWTTDTSGSPEPGGELRFTFTDGTAVMRVEERAPALQRWTCLGHTGQPEWEHTTVTFRLTKLAPAITRLQFPTAGCAPGSTATATARPGGPTSCAAWPPTRKPAPDAR